MKEVSEKGIKSDNSTALNDFIVELIQDKKGKSIRSLDLRAIPEAISDYFIVCHGDSTTQVKAIIEHIYKKLKEEWHEVPHHIEGLSQSEWAIIDYTDVVVHVFLKEKRAYYQLEELWSDAVIKEYKDII